MLERPPIDVRPDLWVMVQGILRAHVPQYEVWAFGSRAKWVAKPYSDLDLAVITDQPLSLNMQAALTDAFTESDLPWRVDVVDWASTSATFRQIIERDRVVVQNCPAVCRLSDIANIQGGYAFKSADFGESGVAVVKIANIKPPIVSLKGTDRVDKVKLVGLDRFRLKDGDVLMAMTGATVGKVGRFKETEPAYRLCCTNRPVAI